MCVLKNKLFKGYKNVSLTFKRALEAILEARFLQNIFHLRKFELFQ